MKNDRLVKLIATILIAGSLIAGISSCNGGDITPETSETTEVTTAVTTPAATPTPEPTATPTPTPTIAHGPHQKLKEYEALKDLKYGINSIRVFSDGDMVVATRNDIVNGNYKGSNDGTVALHVIDGKLDQVIAEVDTTPGTDILGTTQDGRIVTYDSEDYGITVWTKDLKTSDKIGKANYGAVYNQEEEVIVFNRYASVCKMSLDGTVTRYLDKLYSTRCLNYDQESKSVVLSADDDNDNAAQTFSLLSLEDSKVVDVVEDNNYGEAYFCGGKLLLSYPYEKKAYVEVRDLDGKLAATYKFKYGAEIATSDLTDKMIVKIPEKYGYNYVKKTLLLADPLTGKYCDTGISLKDTNQIAITYDKYSEHFFIADSVSQKKTKARLIELCPECFDLTEDMKTGELKHYERPEDKYKLGDGYKDLRQKADGIEAKYGVKILIGNEILNRDISYSYKLTSMEKTKLSLEDQISYVDFALDTVEGNLSKYPEGFFEKFKDYRGKGGVCFAMVDRLVNENGNFFASGEFVFKGSTSYIVLDSNWLDHTTTHHELWHAVENIISIVDPDSFSPEEWDKYNPKDFKYTENFETYDSIDYSYMCKNECFDLNPDDIYFARQYGTVYPKEDRATIIESFMGNESWYDPDKYTSCLDEFLTFPHLKAKLDYMGDKCEKVFGSRYWEN